MGGVAAQAQGMHGPQGAPMAGGMFGCGHLDHVLEIVSATDAQRTQIEAIMKAARTDLQAQRDAGAKLHTQALDLYAAPTIDAAAIEALRVQMNANHDAVSKRMTQAMVDAARVLTPDQRAKLAEVMKKRAARMGRHG
jgi:Spy/CpxP family protein refolding chaperone